MSNFRTILLIIVALVTLGGSAFALDHRYAKGSDVQMVSRRLDLKIVADDIRGLQREIFQIEDRAYKQSRELTREERRRIEEKRKAIGELEERRRLIRQRRKK